VCELYRWRRRPDYATDAPRLLYKQEEKIRKRIFKRIFRIEEERTNLGKNVTCGRRELIEDGADKTSVSKRRRGTEGAKESLSSEGGRSVR